MSYDVDIGGESFNYTYNLAPLFRQHFPENEDGEAVGLRLLHGMTGKRAGVAIGQFWENLGREMLSMWRDHDVGEPHLSAKYDARNGWGSLIGAMIFIGQVQAACARNRRKKVRVS